MTMTTTKKVLMALPLVLAVTACTTKNDVDMNTDYQWSKSEAEEARMKAIAEIAKQGEGGVVAAALLMQQNGTYNAQPPRSTGDRIVDVAKAALPAVGNTLVGVGQIAATVYAADAQKDVALTQSNNNTAVAINQSDNDATVTMQTNDTLAGVAEATIVTNTNTSTQDVVCISDATYTCE